MNAMLASHRPGFNKVAIIHDWLVTWAGAEKVLAGLLYLFPRAHLFTMVDFLDEGRPEVLNQHQITTSFIQRLPGARKHYRHYLPLMPLAVEQFDLSEYDLIISSSHAVAKGVITGPDSLHICYCHSPMRYAWDLQQQYIDEAGIAGLKEKLTRLLLHRIRQWDTSSSVRVDHFIANSAYIARRINKCYRRHAEVIYPPVDQSSCLSGVEDRQSTEEYYLAASRLVPYKRIAMIVEAFSRMPETKLIVIGDGPERKKIEQRLSELSQQGQDNIRYLGYQDDKAMHAYLAGAKAFVFAAEEDFGILPVEALANGVPVIAYGKGGVTESVTSETGMFFDQATAESLMIAIQSFEKKQFSSQACRERAQEFIPEVFNRKLLHFLDQCVDEQELGYSINKVSI